MRLRESERVNSERTKNTSISATDLLKTVVAGDARKPISNASAQRTDGLRAETNSEFFVENTSSIKSEEKKTSTKKNMNVERSQPSSNPDQPFEEPRSRQDRRLSSQPYLIPEGGCRRKRNRRSRRSIMRGGSWWMQRTYANRENR